MLVFRSEEHLENWLEQTEASRGATMTVEQQWDLARAWYSDRLSPDWRRRTPEEGRALFEALGLTGSFWSLTPR